MSKKVLKPGLATGAIDKQSVYATTTVDQQI
jgi:hypothetical protein